MDTWTIVGIVLLVLVLFRGPDVVQGPPQVIDGDTLAVGGQRVQLEGIDAPEHGQSCESSNGRRYSCGLTAVHALHRRINRGHVRCEVRGRRDRFGSRFGTCYTQDGTDLNGWLVRRGFALADWKQSKQYIPYEEAARAEGIGVHAGRYVPPWLWRDGERLP